MTTEKHTGLGDKKPFHARLPNSLRGTLETSAKLANHSLNAHILLLLEGSIAAFPLIEMAPAIAEPLSKATFGIRFQDSLKAEIHDAARKCGRAMNTEIVIRLLMAVGGTQHLGGISPYIPSERIEADLQVTWLRLSQAIEAMLNAGMFNLSSAAVELRAAKAEYERLVHLKNLEMNTSAAITAS